MQLQLTKLEDANGALQQQSLLEARLVKMEEPPAPKTNEVGATSLPNLLRPEGPTESISAKSKPNPEGQEDAAANPLTPVLCLCIFASSGRNLYAQAGTGPSWRRC